MFINDTIHTIYHKEKGKKKVRFDETRPYVDLFYLNVKQFQRQENVKIQKIGIM